MRYLTEEEERQLEKCPIYQATTDYCVGESMMRQYPNALRLEWGAPARLPDGARVAVIYETAKGREVIAEGLRDEVRLALGEEGMEVLDDPPAKDKDIAPAGGAEDGAAAPAM